MKKTLLIYFILILSVLFGCSSHKKKRINLSGFSDRNEVVYETQKAKFIFSKNSILDYCNKTDTQDHNNFIYRQVVEYLKNYSYNSIVISDTLGTEMTPYNTVYSTSIDNATLIRVRNEKKEYAFVPEAMNWILLDLIQNGKLKIYDKTANQFVDYIIFHLTETKTYGESEILLPNDSSIFIKMRWIR